MKLGCPSPVRLRQLVEDQLSSEEEAAINQHLVSCSRCRGILDTLTAFSNGPVPSTEPPQGILPFEALRFPGELPPPGALTPAPLKALDLDAFQAHPVFPSLPGFEVECELGRGGLGVVFRALDTRLHRTVALKMIVKQATSPLRLARFRREVELTARLQHPHVVRIFEIGEHQGEPFFTMEYAAAGSLGRWLSGTPVPAKIAAQLMEILARAVHAIHAEGIIHRDLKPSNILLAPAPPLQGIPLRGPQGEGYFRPLIADFGLAKDLEADHSLSSSRDILGTPEFMAPEQAQGRSDEIGPWTDVYALGALLYHVLVGVPPFRSPSVTDTLVQVVFSEPPPPSRIQPGIPRELEAVCLRCLAKDRRRRYASAGELADDLLRFREGRPTAARPPTLPGRMVRWAQRNPLAGTLLLALSLSSAAALGFALLAQRHAHEATSEAARAGDQARIAKHQAYVADMRLAQRAWDDRDVGLLRRLLIAHEPEPGTSQDSRNFEWHHWKQRVHREAHSVYLGSLIWGISADRSGKLLAVVYGLKAAIWDTETWELLWSIPLESTKSRLALSPDGRFVAEAHAGKAVVLREARTGRPIQKLTEMMEFVSSMEFSPDGSLLACQVFPGKILFWDTKSGQKLPPSLKRGTPAATFSFSPNGEYLAIVCSGVEIEVWSLATRSQILTIRDGDSAHVVFSPDSRQLISGTRKGKKSLWKMPEGTKILEFGDWREPHGILWLSPDGTRLAQVVNDQAISILKEPFVTQIPEILMGHTRSVHAGAFLGNNRLATGGGDGRLCVWDLDRSSNPVCLGAGQNPLRGTFSPSGDQFVTTHNNGSWKTWNTNTGELISTKSGGGGTCYYALFDAEGHLITSHEDGAVRFWRSDKGSLGRVLESRLGKVVRLTLSSDGKQLAGICPPGHVVVWDLESQGPAKPLRHTSQNILDVAYAPTGKTLALAGPQGVTCWEGVSKAEPIPFVDGNTFRACRLAYHPQGHILACGEMDGRIHLVDATTGATLHELAAHKHGVADLAFSPDGSRLASVDVRGMVRLWDPRTGDEVMTLIQNSVSVWGLTFDSTGTRLALMNDRGITIWKAPRTSGRP